MKNREVKGSVSVLLPILMLLFLTSCASKVDIVGKWREVGKEARIEFSADGTFQAIDNQGMAVSGEYILFKDGILRCEIQHKRTSKEVGSMRILIKGDELTLSALHGNEIEICRRE